MRVFPFSSSVNALWSASICQQDNLPEPKEGHEQPLFELKERRDSWWSKFFPHVLDESEEIKNMVGDRLALVEVDGVKQSTSVAYSDLYLRQIVYLTQSILDSLSTAGNSVLSVDTLECLKLAFLMIRGDYAEKNLETVVWLTDSIYRNAYELKDRVKVSIDFLESFKLAYIILNHEDGFYFDRETHRLSADVLRIDKDACYVLFPNYPKSHSNSNLLGQGTFKTAYLALRIINHVNATPTVQYLPARGETNFQPGVIKGIRFLNSVGCLKCYGIFSDLLPSGCKVDEMAFVEYWEGGDLSLYSHRKFQNAGWKPLTLDEQIKIAKNLSCQLYELHKDRKRGYGYGGHVHGDMKAANCLVRGKGGKLQASIADGDLARGAYAGGLSTRQAMYGGSLPYTPPEMLKSVYSEYGGGQKADVYALGLILYEIAIGVPPWYSQLLLHDKQYAEAISALEKQLKADIKKSPTRRNQLMDRFIDSLKALVNKDVIRKEVIQLQEDIVSKIQELKMIANPTKEQKFHLLIYRLLHPNPNERVSLDDVVTEHLGCYIVGRPC